MAETFDASLRRTHTCGQLRAADVGAAVRLCGWVRSYRNHGGVLFIDLRDRDGVTQVIFDPAGDKALHDRAAELRNEWVVAVGGTVQPRGEGRVNPEMPTGEIEVLAGELTLLNRSDPVPVEPDAKEEVAEETRLQYRYLDLRGAAMTHNLRLRHQICRAMRLVLDQRGFTEIETPFLTKSTPEGARDFLVPARNQPGCFYALPQSPQLFKQILMVAGQDRYYQLVRCFRDEDPRADRQVEFTQLDVEMSFVTEADVLELTNAVMAEVCRVAGRPFPQEVPVLTYAEAMEAYGSDRPDLRFEMPLRDVSRVVAGCEFKIFSQAVGAGGAVKALCAPGGGKLSRKQIDALAATATEFGAKGLCWCKVEPAALAGGTAKFLDESTQAGLRQACSAGEGDLLLMVADKPAVAARALGEIRVRLGAELKLYADDQFAWCWVTDFPLVEWDEAEQRWDSSHHPFTSPRGEDLDKLDTDPGSVLSRSYDIVCNGAELGGGSIRIHSPQLQRRIFKLLGISDEAAAERFGFFLEALRYGTPPHGGIALGLDRIVMMMAGGESIRDAIAFPKTLRGACPLTGAPAGADQRQLDELGIRIAQPPTGEDSNAGGD